MRGMVERRRMVPMLNRLRRRSTGQSRHADENIQNEDAADEEFSPDSDVTIPHERLHHDYPVKAIRVTMPRCRALRFIGRGTPRRISTPLQLCVFSEGATVGLCRHLVYRCLRTDAHGYYKSLNEKRRP